MSHGACRAISTPDGALIRKDGESDGRYRKRKGRETPYYLRLSAEWFKRLESLLDVPHNRVAGTAIAGCVNRADLIEDSFDVFLQVHALARELNIRDANLLVYKMIEATRLQERVVALEVSSNVKQANVALLPPPDANS